MTLSVALVGELVAVMPVVGGSAVLAALVGSSGPVLGPSVLAGDEPVPLPPLSVPLPSVPPVSPGQAAQAHSTANKPRTPAT